jgi:parallel beta-helix repeat protein
MMCYVDGAALVSGIVVLTAWTNCARAAEELTIDRDNIAITQSVSIRPGRYNVKDTDKNGVLQVKADDVEIDFHGATLQAADPETADLTRAEGIGIAIDGHKNVTIRNANVYGYAFNIRSNQAPGLKLENCNVSFSRAQRIAVGTQTVEIWLTLRSLDAWRSYGAGMWIESSDGARIENCRGSGAQDGLLLVNSSDCTVSGCDFSYNSGFGIGLWNSSRNVVAWNHIDFVNRPWGGGWGADSASFVVVGGSNENYIVGNSFTHGGDGFFLTDLFNGGFSEKKPVTEFAGRCDGNIIAYNDGSWSPCNAFEGTFSFGNVYYHNLADDSGYGFWLGYSSDTLLLENEILRNRNEGIAIEHGHGNRIEANRIAENRGAAVALWAEGPEWLLKLHPSRDNDIRGNSIRRCGRAFRLNGSTNTTGADNAIEDTPPGDVELAQGTGGSALTQFKSSPQYARLQEILKAKPKDFRMLRDEPGPKGIEWIRAEEYSPRDYRGKLVAWRNRDAATLEMLPITTEQLDFSTPRWITVKQDPQTKCYVATPAPQPGPGQVRDYTIEVQTRQGRQTQKITGAFLTAEWDVRWFRWGQPKKLAYDDAAGWKKLFDSKPLYRQTTRELSTKLWAGGMPPGVPRNDFAILAETKVKLPAGRYRVSTISDDGIRVFLDGKDIISRWNHHGSTPDQAEVDIAEGVHEWVVHYFQEDGASALIFNWQKLK